MTRFAAWMMAASAALLVAGCQTRAPASSCDGWKRLTPAAQTRAFVIVQDRPFAEQVAAHNLFGAKAGCWK